MFNILNHKGNANQNIIEISARPNENGYHQENKKQMLVRMGAGKEPSDTVDGDVKECSHCVKSVQLFLKIN
jgi:hypothetical protein